VCVAPLRLTNSQVPGQCVGPRGSSPSAIFASRPGSAERNEMNRSVINLIAATERNKCGYADVPPGSVNDEIESELAAFGYAVALSDHLWIGGYRVHTLESIQFGNYRPYVSPSIFTCASSRSAHVPDARDFDLEAIIEVRGEIPAN